MGAIGVRMGAIGVRRTPARVRLAAVAVSLLALLAFSASARGATLTVTKQTDSNDGSCTPSLCSLRDAVTNAGAGDTVLVPASASHYAVTLGEIPISVAPLTIQGGGASATVIDAGGSSRVFHVTSGVPASGTITFQAVTITGGNATTMPGGGGILVSSLQPVDVSLVNAVLSGNTVAISSPSAGQAGGGGIYNNSGSVSLTGSSVSNNSVTVGGNTAMGAQAACCDGGGGIYAESPSDSNITLSNSVVSNNTVNVSDNSCCNGGGGVYENGTPGNVTVSRSQLTGNAVTVNGTQTDVTTGVGNCCSGGGAVYQDSGSTSLSGATLSGNRVTVGSGGTSHGGGALLDNGLGGAIGSSTLSNNSATINGPSGANSNAHCCSGGGALLALTRPNAPVEWTVSNATLDGNSTGVTAGDCCHGGGAIQIFSAVPLATSGTTISNNRSLISGGTLSGGGGVYEDIHALVVGSYTNSTISGNTTNAGGVPEMGGGGIYLNNSQTYAAVLANVTLAGNSAPQGSGGGIYNYRSEVDVKNSIVALNSAAAGGDCYNGGLPPPVFKSLGYNLEDAPDTCSFTAAGDKAVAASSIGLGPLANNGGPTQTRALLPGSPAIDAGNPAGCTDPGGAPLTTDQRGFKRPSNGRCDIGAFELQFGAATCTLKAKSDKVLLHPRKRKLRRLKGRLQLKLVCNQAARVALSGKLSTKRGRHRKAFKLSLGTSVSAGKTVTILLKLPKKALRLLSHKAKGSVALSLAATNANGVGTASLKIKKLKVKRR